MLSSVLGGMRRRPGCARSGWRIRRSGSFIIGGDDCRMDTPVAPPGGGPYPPGMEARVAVLEETARHTLSTLERLERRFDRFEARQQADFRWLLGVMLGGFPSM